MYISRIIWRSANGREKTAKAAGTSIAGHRGSHATRAVGSPRRAASSRKAFAPSGINLHCPGCGACVFPFPLPRKPGSHAQPPKRANPARPRSSKKVPMFHVKHSFVCRRCPATLASPPASFLQTECSCDRESSHRSRCQLIVDLYGHGQN